MEKDGKLDVFSLGRLYLVSDDRRSDGFPARDIWFQGVLLPGLTQPNTQSSSETVAAKVAGVAAVI